MVAFGLSAAVAAGACGQSAEPPSPTSKVETRSAALGQPNGDHPNYDERVVLYASNRARVDPAAEGWPAYKPQPPLQWHFDLNRAARAHAQDMRDTPCFQHNSCNGGDMSTRIRSFYTGPWMSLGENISAGVNNGSTVVHNWIFEIGAPAGETGHRDNIFSAKYTLMGAGYAAGGTRFKGYWTQDFIGTPITRPRMTDGIHTPSTTTAGGMITFGTTYEDVAAPAQIVVVVAGTCTSLSLVRGTASRGAYEAKVTLPAGCHPYHFVAAGAGQTATYPDPGSLQVAVGVDAAACPLATVTRAEITCAGGADGGGGGAPVPLPADAGAERPSDTGGTSGSAGAGGSRGSGGRSGTAGSGGVVDAGAVPPAGRGGATGTATGGDPGTTGGGGSAPSEMPPSQPAETASGCALAGRSAKSASLLFPLLPLALLATRRRRRAR
ncbi:MAG TPA: CAP domain-containing protein [Polyangia bacterium]